jgi:hypothetical protein
MIDWNMGRTSESLNSGGKTPVVATLTALAVTARLTADRSGVGQPSRERLVCADLGARRVA